MKKAVLIIAYKNFQDREYSVTKEVLENGGTEVKTAASQKGTAEGVFGLKASVDLLAAEINLADFDAVVFIGGGGALEYLDNEISYNLTRETIRQNKLLAAICVAPVILARAGALKNKKATVWQNISDKESIKILEKNGAEFINKDVVFDGKIITANGPAAAEKFGESILKLI
ncbi:MAG: DJ-1/PfpI family protein [Patescibacteria group bacterium]